MAKSRNYAAEYQARKSRAVAQGYGSYHRKRYGEAGRSTDMGSTDLDRTSARRRIHEAIQTYDEDIDDWEEHAFDSTRVLGARYSPTRQQLIVLWKNDPSGQRYPSYIYDAVPVPVWTGFTGAGSPGQYVNYALNSYPYRPAPGAMP